MGVATALFAAVFYVGNAQAQYDPQPLRMADHSRTAVQVNLAPERSLLEGNGITIVQGEMVLWEAYKPPAQEPLGDIARRLRAQNDGLAKAKVHWEGPAPEPKAQAEVAMTPQSPLASQFARRKAQNEAVRALDTLNSRSNAMLAHPSEPSSNSRPISDTP